MGLREPKYKRISMAKLYATLSSDKTGRTVSKGGNEYIEITIYNGNNEVMTLLVQFEEEIVPTMNFTQTTDGVTVRNKDTNELIGYRITN